jgi:hypothetical protein
MLHRSRICTEVTQMHLNTYLLPPHGHVIFAQKAKLQYR